MSGTETPATIVRDGFTFVAGTCGDGTRTAMVASYDGDAEVLVIPDEIDGMAVDTIGDYAFEESATLRDVHIPDSVTDIMSGAFLNCPELRRVRLPRHLDRIDNAAFGSCPNLVEVTVPESVDTVGYDVFDGTALPRSITRHRLFVPLDWKGDEGHRQLLEDRCPFLDLLYDFAIDPAGAIGAAVDMPWRDASMEDYSLRCHVMKTLTALLELYVIDFHGFDVATDPTNALLQSLAMVGLRRKRPDRQDFEGFRAVWSPMPPEERVVAFDRCGFSTEGWLDGAGFELMEAEAFRSGLVDSGTLWLEKMGSIEQSSHERIEEIVASLEVAPGVLVDIGDSSIEHCVWVGFAGDKVVLKEYDLYD